MAKTKTTKPRPRQPMLLEELEPLRLPDLDGAADNYHGLKERRMELLREEVEAKAQVAELMKEHSLTAYTTASDLEVTREHESVDTVKVKRKKSAPTENGDGD